MDKKKQVKRFKVTNTVVLLEAIVIVVLLIGLLVVDWSGSDSVDESSQPVMTQSSSLTEMELSLPDTEESSNSNTEVEKDSKPQLEQTESSFTLQEDSKDEATMEEETVITEESEESPSQENWGEIDWN